MRTARKPSHSRIDASFPAFASLSGPSIAIDDASTTSMTGTISFLVSPSTWCILRMRGSRTRSGAETLLPPEEATILA